MYKELKPHQLAALEKFRSRPEASGLCLFHGTGMGKTLTALCIALDSVGSGRCKRALVVCPKNVEGVWRSTLQNALDSAGNLGLTKLKGLEVTFLRHEEKSVEAWEKATAPSAIEGSCVIIDEAHLLLISDPGLMSSKTYSDIRDRSGFVLCLTATPVVSERVAQDLSTLVNITIRDPALRMPVKLIEFEKRFTRVGKMEAASRYLQSYLNLTRDVDFGASAVVGLVSFGIKVRESMKSRVKHPFLEETDRNLIDAEIKANSKDASSRESSRESSDALTKYGRVHGRFDDNPVESAASRSFVHGMLKGDSAASRMYQAATLGWSRMFLAGTRMTFGYSGYDPVDALKVTDHDTIAKEEDALYKDYLASRYHKEGKDYDKFLEAKTTTDLQASVKARRKPYAPLSNADKLAFAAAALGVVSLLYTRWAQTNGVFTPRPLDVEALSLFLADHASFAEKKGDDYASSTVRHRFVSYTGHQIRKLNSAMHGFFDPTDSKWLVEGSDLGEEEGSWEERLAGRITEDAVGLTRRMLAIGNMSEDGGEPCPKFVRLSALVDGKVSCVYSQFWKHGGLLVAEHLRSAGRVEGRDLFVAPRGGQATIDAFNRASRAWLGTEAAKREGQPPLIVLHPSLGVGISLSNVQSMVILEPIDDVSRMEQVTGRAVRMGSHADLDPKLRTLAVTVMGCDIPFVSATRFFHNLSLWLENSRETAPGTGSVKHDLEGAKTISTRGKDLSPDRIVYIRSKSVMRNADAVMMALERIEEKV
jgi:SNF2-related domain